MSENFKKLKRKYVLGAILKSVVCGLSFGLIAAGIVLLALKLSAISIDVIWYVLIGVGAAVLGGAVAFVIFRPTNKKVALRLDEEYALEERVQTSLEFSGQSGTILDIQRLDTEKKLQALPKKRLKFSKIWQFCAIAVLAVAVGCTAFFIPAAQAAETPGPIDPEDEPVTISGFQKVAVQNLINDVRSSYMREPVRENSALLLEDFLVELDTIETRGELLDAVNETTSAVAEEVAVVTTFIKVATALSAVNETVLANAISNGGNAYRRFDITYFEDVEAFYADRQNNTTSRVSSALTNLRNRVDINDSAQLIDALRILASPIMTALSDLVSKAEVDASDQLYFQLNTLAGDLAFMVIDLISEDKGVEEIQDELNSSFETFGNGIVLELADQAYHGATRRYVNNRLRNIFGIEDGIEVAELDSGNTSGDGGTGGGNIIDDGPGGGGTGETQYASNDMVYDPRTGEYVKYGDILNDYMAILQEQIEKGMLTEQQEKMVRDYFDSLNVKKDD